MRFYYFFFMSLLLLKNLFLFCQTEDLDAIHKIQRNAVVLLEKAVSFLNREGLDVACQAFALDPAWKHNSIALFIFGVDGRVYVDNGYFDCFWRNLGKRVDFFGDPLIPTMIAQGQSGGWVTHLFLNDIRHSYVKLVTLEGKTYIVGATFFHQSPVLLSILIVEAMKRLWERDGDISAIQLINNPFGSLVYGNAYGIVMNTEGVCWAHGNNVLLVGRSLTDPSIVGKSASVAFKKVIETIKHQDHFWVEFEENGLTRALYCRKFMSGKLRKTFIFMAGYYKNFTPELVKSVTRKIGDGLKNSKNVHDYLNRLRRGDFTHYLKGDLDILVTDAHDVVHYFSNKARGAAFLGKSIINYVDTFKRPYNKMLFAKLMHSPDAWVSRFLHGNVLERIYGYKVETPEGAYIVQARGYYPYEHREVVQIIVDDAHDYLEASGSPKAFDALKDVYGYFVKGTHSIFLYDTHGICWVSGIRESNIWSKSDFMASIPEGFSDEKKRDSIRRWFVRKMVKQFGTKESFVVASYYYPEQGEKNEK